MTQPTDTRELVSTIAQQLGETQSGPINQIRRIVQRLGPTEPWSSCRKRSRSKHRVAKCYPTEVGGARPAVCSLPLLKIG